MTTEDIERLVKLHQGTTDNDIRRIILKLLEIKVVKRSQLEVIPAFNQPLEKNI